jgi:hypothetical protein
MVRGLGDSIFLVDPSILNQKYAFPSRLQAYLTAWFASGLIVIAPPDDFECILNEPIWFNRFLYLSSDTKRGRFQGESLEDQLIRRGFTHLTHFLSPSSSADAASSPWLTLEEARFQTGSNALGNAIYTLIELIPNEWSKIVRLKLREPFRLDD